MDYSDAHFIAVADGDVALYNDYDYIVHRTNLSEYGLILQETENVVRKFTDSREIGLIREQMREIDRLLEILRTHRRHARSLDFLGSALKFIAGTPDHSDLEVINAREEALTENNNKQTTINTVLQDRINDLTDRVNAILERNTDNSIKEDELVVFELMVERNGEIISFLNGLALSIVLAKENIINPIIFSGIDVKTLKPKEIPISFNDILKSSNVSVFQKEDIIFHMIKYPVLKNFCKFLKIYPVIHNNSIVKLELGQASKCSNYTIPVDDCTSVGSAKICRETYEACLFQLLNNNTAICLTQSADHIPPIEKLSEGSILLNDVLNTDIGEENKIKVNGTVLITFENSVTINGTIFRNDNKKQKALMEPHPPKIINVIKNSHETKITLPYLHKINLENYNLISEIQKNMVAHKVTIIVTAVFMLILSCLMCRSRKSKKTSIAEMEDIIEKIRSKQGRSDI